MIKQSEKILHKALIKNHVLSVAQVQTYVAEAQTAGMPFKDYLLSKEIVTTKQILIALSQSLNLDIIHFNEISIEQPVIERVPIKFAWYYKIMPIKIENNVLTIASAAPLDIKTQDDIRVHLGIEVNVVLADEHELIESFKKYYGFASDTIDRIMSKGTVKTSEVSSQSGQWIEDLEKQSEDPTVSHLVNEIILEAYNQRATDIHIEPYRDKVRIRYRIDGVLVDAHLPNDVKHFLLPILSRIKILANLSITEKRLPQDGSAVVKTKDQHLDLRVSTMPTPRGESMVIRILPTKVMLFSLEKLGFDPEGVKIFRELIKKPHGIVFITGPTGSGKTTTLYACLNEINSSHRKIITIEDPVEYEMEGITQVQVNPKVNFHFSTGLRSLLRHDPDIIMVGEVRDLETAEIAIRTALTGHLVFSTLHTNDAASGITRLIDMGLESYLVASSVEAFVAQRLVRVICTQCKEEVVNPMTTVKNEIMRSLNLDTTENIKIYKGKGCDRCNRTGFYGRMAIYEILVLNETIRSAILEKSRPDYIKGIAMKEGLVTLRQNGWKTVLNGLTTPEEIMNVTVKDEFPEASTADNQKVCHVASADDSTAALPGQDINIARLGYVKNGYESRNYARTFEPVPIKYRPLKRDLKNPSLLKPDSVEFETVTKDISAGGLRFNSEVFFSTGSALELKIELGREYKTVQCLAKVCRVEENKKGPGYDLMAFYLDLAHQDRLFIDQFVDKKIRDESKSELQEKTALSE